MINFMNTLQENRKKINLGEQAHWNYALKYNRTISVAFLPIKLFACGDEFYVKGGRIFFDDFKSIAINIYILDNSYITVHNNWITGMDKKLYREKEMHFFNFDYNSYYTSISNKYIIFNFTSTTLDEDELIIKLGLVTVLMTDSILILPQIKCNHCKRICRYCKSHTYCSYIEFWKIRDLNKYFHGSYRESVFLLYINFIDFSITSSNN